MMVLKAAYDASLGLVLLLGLLDDRTGAEDVSYGVFIARGTAAGLAVFHQDRDGDLAGRVVTRGVARARGGSVVDVARTAATVLQLLLGHGFLFRLAFALVPVVLEPDLHLHIVVPGISQDNSSSETTAIKTLYRRQHTHKKKVAVVQGPPLEN